MWDHLNEIFALLAGLGIGWAATFVYFKWGTTVATTAQKVETTVTSAV